MKTYKAIQVKWQDHIVRYGWVQKEDYAKPSTINSIGWLMEETKDYIVISTSISLDTLNCTEPLTILKSCILDRRKLKL